MSVDVVLIGRQNRATAAIHHALSQRFRVHTILETPPSTFRLLRGRVRKQGLLRVVGQVLFQLFIAKPQHSLSNRRIEEILAEAELRSSPIPQAASTQVDTVNGSRCWEAVRHHGPAVVVINGTRILSRTTLSAFGVPVLNMHVGITPRYRGVHGAYWALVHDEPQHCGVTVHLVDEGVDTGEVLYQSLIRPNAEDDFSTYPSLQLAAGVPLLLRAVQHALEGTLHSVPGAPGDQRWYHPTLWQYCSNRFLKGVK